MKLHTNNLADSDLSVALDRAKRKGHVAKDIYFVTYNPEGSRKRSRGFEIQLGTDDKTSGPGKSRHYKNSGNAGAGQVWAATYDEWGYFLAEVFVMDESAVFGPYDGHADFHDKTNYAYEG